MITYHQVTQRSDEWFELRKIEKLIRPLMEKGFIKFIDGDYFLTEKIDT